MQGPRSAGSMQLDRGGPRPPGAVRSASDSIRRPEVGGHLSVQEFHRERGLRLHGSGLGFPRGERTLGSPLERGGATRRGVLSTFCLAAEHGSPRTLACPTPPPLPPPLSTGSPAGAVRCCGRSGSC